MITLNLSTGTVSRYPTGDVNDPPSWSVTVPAGSPGIMAAHAEVEAMCAGFRLVKGWQRDENRSELWHMGELVTGSIIPECRGGSEG